MTSLTLGQLHGNTHCREEPAIGRIAAQPARLERKPLFDQSRHGFNRRRPLPVSPTVARGPHLLDHRLARRRLIHAVAGDGQQLHLVFPLEQGVEFLIIGFAVHTDLFDHSSESHDFSPEPLGFMRGVGHPVK
jgi:hypothetical protein